MLIMLKVVAEKAARRYLEDCKPKKGVTGNLAKYEQALGLALEDRLNQEKILASVHSDGRTPEDLFEIVDKLLAEAKFYGTLKIFAGTDLKHGRLFYSAEYMCGEAEVSVKPEMLKPAKKRRRKR